MALHGVYFVLQSACLAEMIEASYRMSFNMRRRVPATVDEPVVGLHERALDNVAFVRGIMERTTHFTAVPGWGGIAMGVTAVIAAYIAARQATPALWLSVWVGEAVVASFIALGSSALKARRNGASLAAGPARRFALCLLPAIVAGAALTFAAAQSHSYVLLPAIWLLLYGTGVCAAGAVSSPPVVSILGIALIVGGVATAVSPAAWSNWYLALFFGLGHAAAGAVIVRHHGG